jgi:membrane protein
MKKHSIFVFNLAVRCKHNEIFERAAALTLRVLLAFFPFIIFLMALMGRMDINGDAIIRGLYGVLPVHVSELVEYVLHQLTGVQNAAIMSAALFFLIYNITRGFRAVLRSTNMAYGVEERRGLGAQIGLSFVLMLLFAAAVIIMLGILVFGWQILSYIFPYGNPALFFILSALAAMVVLFMFVSFIYKLACATPTPQNTSSPVPPSPSSPG